MFPFNSFSENWFDESLGEGGEDAPVDPGTVEIKLSLGSFTVEPFLWPHLADRITVDWTDANITACKVYLEGQDETRVLLNDNEPGVAKQRPAGQTTEYAGSWAQDYGAGILSDMGADLEPEGVSATHLADPHLATAFQMLADRTAKYLVFVIDVADMGETVSVKWPELEYTKAADRKLVPENAHQTAVIHPNGAGVRTGIFDTGVSGTIDNPPALYDPTARPNIIDWLVTERLLVRGVAHNDGLTSELTSLYDSYEGQSVGNVRNASNAFWLPEATGHWTLALVNSMAEIPPLGAFPRRERNTTTWLESGDDYVQHSWIWAQSHGYLVCPKDAAHLEGPSGIVTSGITAPAGWAITRHAHPLDNTEAQADYSIVRGTEFAEVRPWRGWYMVLVGQTPGSGIAIACRSDRYLALARIEESIRIKFAYAGQTWGPEVDTTIDAIHVAIAWDYSKEKRLVMVTSEDDDVALRYTEDNGENWSSLVTVGSGIRPAIGIDFDGQHFIYWLDGDAIKGRRYDASLAPAGAEFTVHSGVDTDGGVDVAVTIRGSGQVTVDMVHIDGSGGVIHTTSQDGEVFA